MISGTLLALIMAISVSNNVDPALVRAIILVENRSVDAKARGRNSNGTYDLGLMQLNSGWFKSKQWDDPTVNITAGIKHIAYLQTRLDDLDDVIMAYNCGYSSVRNGRIPASSKEYLRKVRMEMAEWRD